jgi:hypothetical protein
MLALGCGGGVPLLHGPHALAPGATTTGVGFSGQFITGAARNVVEAASRSEGSTPERDALLAKEGALQSAMDPAIAPFVGMRMGLAGDNEVGLSYTGRYLRFDGRHAFESGPWAWSLGAGVSATWNAPDQGDDAAGVRTSGSTGAVGFDVPLLVGWQSDAGVVSIWAGARGGAERIGAWSSSGEASSLALTHWHAGGTAGLAMGFRHIHVALELESAYHGVEGKFGTAEVEVHGVTLTPAGGLLFTF